MNLNEEVLFSIQEILKFAQSKEQRTTCLFLFHRFIFDLTSTICLVLYLPYCICWERLISISFLPCSTLHIAL